MIHQQPFIVSVALDAASLAYFDGLRQTYFPPERNFIGAHITLFHALPASEIAPITAMLSATCRQNNPSAITFPSVRFLGRGVAIEAVSPELSHIHHELADAWQLWLTPQDRQRFKPHVTIQNKVMPDVARALHHELSQSWQPRTATAIGLTLWRYLGGPWEHVREFPFEATSSS